MWLKSKTWIMARPFQNKSVQKRKKLARLGSFVCYLSWNVLPVSTMLDYILCLLFWYLILLSIEFVALDSVWLGPSHFIWFPFTEPGLEVQWYWNVLTAGSHGCVAWRMLDGWWRAYLAHGVVLITETFIVRLTGQQPIKPLASCLPYG